MTHSADTASEQGLGAQGSERIRDAASTAQEKASELRDQGRSRLRDQIDSRSTHAGSQARSLANALRRSGDDLRGDGNTQTAELTGQAADRIERLGSYLEQKSGDDLMRDIETFARRRPWLLAGLGMLAGVAAARFVKASSEDRYDRYRRTDSDWGDARSRHSPRGLTPPPASVVDDRGLAAERRGDFSDAPLARDPFTAGE